MPDIQHHPSWHRKLIEDGWSADTVPFWEGDPPGWAHLGEERTVISFPGDSSGTYFWKRDTWHRLPASISSGDATVTYYFCQFSQWGLLWYPSPSPVLRGRH